MPDFSPENLCGFPSCCYFRKGCSEGYLREVPRTLPTQLDEFLVPHHCTSPLAAVPSPALPPPRMLPHAALLPWALASRAASLRTSLGWG